MTNYHLAILKKPYLDAILAGKKQIESRFTNSKRVPFGKIQAGDEIFLKVSCGPVCAKAVVAGVKNYENLTPAKIAEIKQQYNSQILGDKEYWDSKKTSRFGILVWLKDIKAAKPVKINKNDLRAWVVLSKKQNFGLL